MKRNILKNVWIAGIGILLVSGFAHADVLFQDTFDGSGALGSDWDSWENGNSGAIPGQIGGSYVFGHTGTDWAQAAVQTTSSVDLSAFDSVKFRFDVKDFGGSSTGIGEAGGRTSFIVAEHDSNLSALYGSSEIEGLLFAVEHRSINFGSFPDAATDPRTIVKILKTDNTELGTMVVQSINDFTLVMTMTSDSWAFGVEGANAWNNGGVSSGLHGYDVSTWVGGASLRMESWNQAGTFYPASIDGASITTIPEPATLGLISISMAGLLWFRRLLV